MADHKLDWRIEQLAHEANWEVLAPTILRKEYTFMSRRNAAAFAERVNRLLRQHWVEGRAQASADQVVVEIHARGAEILGQEDVEFALTIEALRTMTAAAREQTEASLE